MSYYGSDVDLQEALVGGTIKGFRLEGRRDYANDDRLVFEMEDGTVIIGDAVGGCCSESWFEHIDNPDGLVGMKVEEVEKTTEEGLGYGTRQDYDQVWFIRIKGKPDKWRCREGCTIELRNSSNGHYGGWVNWKVEDKEES